MMSYDPEGGVSFAGLGIPIQCDFHLQAEVIAARKQFASQEEYIQFVSRIELSLRAQKESRVTTERLFRLIAMRQGKIAAQLAREDYYNSISTATHLT